MSRLGRFALVERIGSGGVAEVWRGRDSATGAAVAIKRLLPQLAGDRQLCRRLLREGEIACGLDHPNIVRVLETGDGDEGPFLVMQLAGDEDLARRLAREGRLAADEACRIARAVAQALGYAHARGIVHRDLKPQNVLLDGDAVKLTDFGLARVETFVSLTGSSLLWGSPEYLAPELFLHGRVDPRTDLYALGVLLHEMIAGRPPGRDAAGVGRPADRAAPVALGAGEALDRLIGALLSPAPSDRPSSAAEVIAVLDGDAPASPSAVRCPRCGADSLEEVPRCLSCGQVSRTLRHTPNGAWRVVLRTMSEDAASMASLNEVFRELRGGVERFKLLSGPTERLSEDEKTYAIELPVTLFGNLDEATAKQIEAMLTSRKLDACAIETRDLRRLVKVRAGGFSAGLLSAVMGGLYLVSPWGNDGHVSPRALLFMGTFLAIAVPMVLLSKKRGALDKIVIPLFTLPDDGDPGPIAAGLLDAAHATGDQLGSPDVRALFGDVARELYRLTRRAEELAQSHPPGSPEEALARRLIGLAPPLGQRLAAVAARLEALDSALGAGSEGDTARALAALDRRAAGADTRDRASLAEARHELEAALERRLAAEGERERLAAALCRLLAAVRDLYRRAAAFPLPEEPEVAALETTLRELAAA